MAGEQQHEGEEPEEKRNGGMYNGAAFFLVVVVLARPADKSTLSGMLTALLLTVVSQPGNQSVQKYGPVAVIVKGSR